MTRRDFVAACVGLAAAWLTGQRMNWRAIFAEPIASPLPRLTYTEAWHNIQAKLLRGFHNEQHEWDDFMERAFA